MRKHEHEGYDVTASTGTIAFFGCTDPRLADVASLMYGQCQSALGGRRVIPFLSPGIVGLYADEKVADRYLSRKNMQGDVSDEDILRMALEASFGKHLVLHDPRVAVLTAHSDCLGFPGNDAKQKQAVQVAAEVLQYRLKSSTLYTGKVLAAIVELCPTAGWTFHTL